jgi:hypothetical protein
MEITPLTGLMNKDFNPFGRRVQPICFSVSGDFADVILLSLKLLLGAKKWLI